MDEIAETTSPVLQISARYKTDDQLLEERSASVDFNCYKSRWLAPQAKIVYTDFQGMKHNPAAINVELGNSFQFGYSGNYLKLSAGIIHQNTESGNT